MGDLADVLREVLDPPIPDPSLPPGAPAAVLIPIVASPEASLLFTVRSDDLRRHSGEISFPGGARHDEDADLLATALRETEEELGIAPGSFDVVGRMGPQLSHVSGYAVVPFVGLLAELPELRPNPMEVAEVLEVPLATLLEVERLVARTWQGATYHTYEYATGGHTVWGLTGRILHELLETIRREGWT